jgi:hypothetical protein
MTGKLSNLFCIRRWSRFPPFRASVPGRHDGLQFLAKEKLMTLNITHSKCDAEDHFEALGFDDSQPNMVIRFDYAPASGWQKWRHGGWLPIDLGDVPANVMVRYRAASPH